MEHAIFINHHSFTTINQQQATTWFEDALQGVLALNSGAGQDRFTFYADPQNGIGLWDISLCSHFTIGDFRNALENTDPDLYLFLIEADDKCPVIDFLNEDELGVITQYDYWLLDQPINEASGILGLAYHYSATLLSLPTTDFWRQTEIQLLRKEPDEYRPQTLTLDNISSCEAGHYHHNKNQENILDILRYEHDITAGFSNWYNAQSSNVQSLINKKLKQAYEQNFNGGTSLFKQLTNADGIKEIRFSNASTGAVRILFKHVKQSRYALLTGFIKKSDNEGYDTEIKRAKSAYDLLNARNKPKLTH